MRPFTPAIAIMLPVVSCFLSGCGGGGANEDHRNRGLNPGVGPFDRHGNYVEAWADDKSKGVAWRADHVVGKPQVAKVEPTIPKSYPAVATAHVTPQSKPTSRRSRRKAPVSGATTPPSRSRVVRSRPSAAKPQSTVKTKPKSKAPLRYSIKKGDTLYALSRKYKTSVSSIQRANGLKGTNLRIGRTLLIPRY
jgi:LysM repeat protein